MSCGSLSLCLAPAERADLHTQGRAIGVNTDCAAVGPRRTPSCETLHWGDSCKRNGRHSLDWPTQRQEGVFVRRAREVQSASEQTKSQGQSLRQRAHLTLQCLRPCLCLCYCSLLLSFLLLLLPPSLFHSFLPPSSPSLGSDCIFCNVHQY